MSVAAFFDVDGTLTRTNVVQPLAWYQRAHLTRVRFTHWVAGLLLQIPIYMLIDRRSRARFHHAFFRRYAGLNIAKLRSWHLESFAENLQRHLFPQALDCVRQHQRQGHRIVLVTGGLDFVMQPLAEFVQADELIAMRLVDRAGLLTGELDGTPVAESHKAALVRDYARRHDIDLTQSYAYGDSLNDMPMLVCTGHPTAVNPDRRLRRLAGKRGWPIVAWRAGHCDRRAALDLPSAGRR